MDSVKSETPPVEINRCNVLYKDQEFYSKSIANNDYKEYTNYEDNYSFYCLSSIILFTMIVIIIIYNAKIKYKENKSIMFYIIIIVILFMSIISSSLALITETLVINGYDYISKPINLTRPCYSTKMNAILYSDEQLNDIYNKK